MHDLTLYENRFATKPMQELTGLSWEEARDTILHMVSTEVAAEKDELPAFAPHVLRRGGTRRNSDVLRVSLIVLDFDGVALSPLVWQLKAAKVRALIYSSPSDDATRGLRRVRVVVPSIPRIAAHCAPERLAMARELGLLECGVEEAKHPCALFYTGRIEGTPEREIICL